MIEGKYLISYIVIPRDPISLKYFEKFQVNIEDMYKFMCEAVGAERFLSVSVFPMLGAGDYFYLSEKTINTYEEHNIPLSLYTNEFSKSNYVDDVIINSHPRFGCLTRNIRQRRGKKVEIQVPIYKDVCTNLSLPTQDEPYPGSIYMDAMAFGMGNTCFQITLGSCSLKYGVFLYDQLVPVTPILVKIKNFNVS